MANRLNIPPPTRVAIGFATVNGKQVPLFIDPEWAKYFESLNTQVNTTSAAVGLPGAAGATGAAGAAVSLGGSDDGGSVEFIPGPPGQPGADGGAGPALMLSLSEESAPEFVPGPQGIQGPPGNDGATVGFLSFEEAGIEFIPGPPGATGVAGPAGAIVALMLDAESSTENIERPTCGGNALTDNDPVTGTGSLVRANTPTLATPNIGAATGTSATLNSAGVNPAGAFTSSGSTGTVTITDSGASGANLKFAGNGATTPNKYIRTQGGNMEWGNSAYSQIVLTLTDAGNLTAVGSILSSNATGGIGYAAGAGGTQTQLTSKSTGVTLNKVTGSITMNAASLAANTRVQFVFTNSAIAAGDTVIIHRVSGGTGNAYLVNIDSTSAGSCVVTVWNYAGGALAEAIVLGFAVVKVVTA